MRRHTVLRRVLVAGVALVLALTMLLSALPLIRFQADAETVQVVDSAAALLDALKNPTYNQSQVRIQLNADMDCSGVEWQTLDVNCTVDGNGHILKGMTTTLFDEIKGTVTGLGVVAEIQNDAAILANSVSGLVNNCFTYGSITLVDYDGAQPVGGFVGSATGKIDACFSMISVNCAFGKLIDNAVPYVGGFIGRIDSNAAVTNCYSAGDVRSDNGIVAGFGNFAENSTGIVQDVYTSCQLRTVSSNAYPSGVNSLYDNQLSIVRESFSNQGLSTKQLMTTTLSDYFAITSTTYPALKVFYSDGWGKEARDIVRVSTAAAAFSDVGASVRMEPSQQFVARADYLTRDSYVDRTNTAYLSWRMDSEVCKLYDTVPMTSFGSMSDMTESGTVDDLLRARLQFSADDHGAKLSAHSGSYQRTWYLTAMSANPYFAGGNGTATAPFSISDSQQLDAVRYYTLIDAANYQVVNDIYNIGEFDPIRYFRGSFDGGACILSAIELSTDNDTAVGLFANATAGTTISNVILHDVAASAAGTVTIGALIGHAEGVRLQNIAVCGTSTVLRSGGTVGGILGEAVDTSVIGALVSVDVAGQTATGGLVGSMTNGELSQVGVTGIVGGKAQLGGLVGVVKNASVVDAYSTAAVISSHSGDEASVGGLVGRNTDGMIQNVYAAGAVDAPSATSGVDVFVGTGISVTSGSYDSTVTILTSANGTAYPTTDWLNTDDFIEFADKAVWKKTATHYPQLVQFAENETLSVLSALSTVPVRYQQYWTDSEALNMTTAWLPQYYLENIGSFDSRLTVLEEYNEGITQLYTVEQTAGFGFEAASGERRAVVRYDDTAGMGMRVAVGIRSDLIRLSYTVSGVADVRTYVELYYKTADTDDEWQGYQLMSTSTQAVDDFVHDVVYDIPEGSLLKLRIRMADDYAVYSVTIGDTVLTLNEQTGYYEAETAVTADTVVDIVLDKTTPAWGLHRESY